METNPPTEKKSNNRVWIIVASVIALCCCLAVVGIAALNILGPAVANVNQQVQDQISYTGIADEVLKNDVITAIAKFEESNTGCTDVQLLGGTVTLAPDQSGDGSWLETWQVLACGESQLYSVAFTPSPAGGTDYSVSRIDE